MFSSLRKINIQNFRMEHLWVLTVFAVCFGYVASLPLDQYDFWHYLKTGKITFLTGKIVDKEIFTFTVPNEPYINLHWLVQVFYYLLYKAGGVSLLLLTHAFIITISFVFVLLLSRKYSENLRVNSGVALLVFVLSVTNFALRPQEFSILFFALSLYLLKTGRYFLILPVFLLWVNCHGAFVLCLILIGIEFLGSINLKTKPYFSVQLLFIFIFMCVFTLFTPWGLKIYPVLFNTESKNYASLVTEWFSPTMHEPAGIVFFLALFLLFFLQNLRKNSWTRTEILTFIFFTLLALRSQRAIIWWAMASVPVYTMSINEIISMRTFKTSNEKNNWILNWVFALVLIVYIIGSTPYLKVKNIILPEPKRYLIAPDTPLLAGEWVRSDKTSYRIFNDFSWGSYFMWVLRDDQKLFITPWLSVFPRKVVREYLLVNRGYALWEKILNEYKVDTLVLNKKEQCQLIPLIKKSKNWELVYEDKLGIVFKRI